MMDFTFQRLKSIRSKYLTTCNDLTISDLVLSENELPRRSFLSRWSAVEHQLIRRIVLLYLYISGGTISILAINKYRIPSPIPFVEFVWKAPDAWYLTQDAPVTCEAVKLWWLHEETNFWLPDTDHQQAVASLSKGCHIWQEFWVYIMLVWRSVG